VATAHSGARTKAPISPQVMKNVTPRKAMSADDGILALAEELELTCMEKPSRTLRPKKGILAQEGKRTLVVDQWLSTPRRTEPTLGRKEQAIEDEQNHCSPRNNIQQNQ